MSSGLKSGLTVRVKVDFCLSRHTDQLAVLVPSLMPAWLWDHDLNSLALLSLGVTQGL